jgi:hypothetical protein
MDLTMEANRSWQTEALILNLDLGIVYFKVKNNLQSRNIFNNLLMNITHFSFFIIFIVKGILRMKISECLQTTAQKW